MKPLKPMLASPAEMDKLRFPVLASPKIDGIRGLVHNNELLSRKLIQIPNKYVQQLLGVSALNGVDGELVVGPANAPNVMQASMSGLMRHDGVPDFTFWVFDLHNVEAPYEKRYKELVQRLDLYKRNIYRINILPQKLVETLDELLEFESRVVANGYEGVIVRDPRAPYKYGRSTAREGYLLKVKRFEDSEAAIVDFVEEQANNNVAEKDNLGRTKRSSAKAGKIGKDVLGAFVVRDLTTGMTFQVGTGITAEQRAAFWEQRAALVGKIVKYKFFPVGVKDAPRHPVFLGFRDERDMS